MVSETIRELTDCASLECIVYVQGILLRDCASLECIVSVQGILLRDCASLECIVSVQGILLRDCASLECIVSVQGIIFTLSFVLLFGMNDLVCPVCVYPPTSLSYYLEKMSVHIVGKVGEQGNLPFHHIWHRRGQELADLVAVITVLYVPLDAKQFVL